MSSIYSMTGFASMQGQAADGTGFTLTLKSVNHRFLDLHLRLPGGCDELEMQVRRALKETVRRGHVEVSVQVVREAGSQVQLNDELLAAYVGAYRAAAERYSVADEPDLNGLLRLPGVMRAETGAAIVDMAAFQAEVLVQLELLTAKLNEVRAQEGMSLAQELRAAMGRLEALAVEASTLREDVRASYAERLRDRMTELLAGAGITDDRVLAEAAMQAERSDVDEELVRLQTHVARFVTLLDGGGELSKRLDFLLQELNREANTLLSKTGGAASGNGLRMTELGLEMKLEIEKAREQVQNLE